MKGRFNHLPISSVFREPADASRVKEEEKLDKMKVLFGVRSRWDKIAFNCFLYKHSFNPIVTAVVFHPTDNSKHFKHIHTQYMHTKISILLPWQKKCLARHMLPFFRQNVTRWTFEFKIEIYRSHMAWLLEKNRVLKMGKSVYIFLHSTPSTTKLRKTKKKCIKTQL